jgi:hypothetical protein
MMIAVASLSLVGLARADALDDDIARELCGTSPSGGLSVPNCTLSVAGKLAFAQRSAQSDDEERPPLPPHAKLAAGAEPPEILGPDFEEALRWRSSVGVQVGSMTINDQSLDYILGITATSGIQLDRLIVRGEYTLSGVHYTGPNGLARGGLGTQSDTAGVMQRVGIAGRYAFGKLDSPSYVGEPQGIGEMFIEGGAGWEHIAWDKGGVYQRPDVTIGIGLTGAVRGEHSRSGMTMAFRMYVGRRTDLDGAAPTCSAPCTEATPPTAWSDRSYMFDAEYTFGN